jgi:hypothetical protein
MQVCDKHVGCAFLSTLVQVTGLVHDLGKLLSVFGSQGQWDVVGVRLGFCLLQHDTEDLLVNRTHSFGCNFSDKIIYPHTFVDNPDSTDKVYGTENGIYEPTAVWIMLCFHGDTTKFVFMIRPKAFV